VPVWLALSAAPEWRWMRHRSDSPWYPTMRLFRQQTLGSWSSVFEEMKAELAKLVLQRGQASAPSA
jgi:predicted esterase